MKQRSGSPWRSRGPDPFTLHASLWIVDRLRTPIRWLGIEFPIFRLVLEQRLRMESPAQSIRAAGGARAGAAGSIGLGEALTMGWILLMGLVPGVFALVTRDPLLWMLSGQTLWIFTLALLTVMHFANVLVDPTDVGVLASRPVDGRTLFATRIAHVLAPVLVYAGCAALVPVFFGLFVLPPLVVLVAYPLATLSSAAFVIGGVTLAIAVALRVVGPARFQRVVFWGQVGGAMLLMIGSQIAPRLMSQFELLEFLEGRPWLGFLFPPLAEYGFYRLLSGAGERYDLVFAALVVTLPIGIGVLAMLFVSRSFVAALADSGTLVTARTRGFEPSFFARLGPRVCSTGEACAAYGLALALSRRDRLFLRSVLPMLGMVTAMAVVMMVPRGADEVDMEWASAGIYFVLMLGATTFEMSRLSEHPEARVWRRTLPVASEQALMEGSAKALLCGTLFPLLLVISAAMVALLGPDALGDVALALPLAAAALTFTARAFLRGLPFTDGTRRQTNFDRLPRFMGLALALGLLIGVHMLVRLHPVSHGLAVVAALLLFRPGWRRLTRWRLEPGRVRLRASRRSA